MGECLCISLPTSFNQLLVNQNAGQLFVRRKLTTGLLSARFDLLGLLSLLAVELLLHRLDLSIEILPGPPQLGFMLQRQRFKRARLGIHLKSQHRIFFLLLCDQSSELLIAFQRLCSVAQFGFKLLYLRLKVTQLCTGVWWRHKRAGLKPGTVPANRLVIPNRQGASDLKAVHRIFVLGLKLMRGLVAFNTQRVK